MFFLRPQSQQLVQKWRQKKSRSFPVKKALRTRETRFAQKKHCHQHPSQSEGQRQRKGLSRRLKLPREQGLIKKRLLLNRLLRQPRLCQKVTRKHLFSKRHRLLSRGRRRIIKASPLQLLKKQGIGRKSLCSRFLLRKTALRLCWS